MHSEGLNGALHLVASMIAWWHQLKLYLLLVDVLLECIQCFIVQHVFLYSKPCHSHPVDCLFVCPYHFLLQPIVHWFDENLVCSKVDCHHYVHVALLRCEGECSCSVSVDGVSEVINAEESFVGFGDRYLVGG